MIKWKLKFLLLLLLITMVAEALSGQVKLSRQVVDSATGAPVKGADISIRGKSINVVLTTDVGGRFEITTADSLVILLISAEGYNIYTRQISPYNDVEKLIKLQKKLINLREVTVSANFGGVRIRKDTTEFTADSIPQRYSADVMEMLSYIPGLKIENGAMFYNGEPIEFIQIEGNEYTSTTIVPFLKSIMAKNIDKVQIIDRAKEQVSTEITPGNGARESILNITLKTDAKKKILGAGLVGAGTEESKAMSIVANRFLEKDQVLVAVKYDNVNNAVESGSISNGGRSKQGDVSGSYSRKLSEGNKFNLNVHYNQTSIALVQNSEKTEVLDSGQQVSNSIDSSTNNQQKFTTDLTMENKLTKAIRSITMLHLDKSWSELSQNSQFQYFKSNIFLSNGFSMFEDKSTTNSCRVLNNLIFSLPPQWGTLRTAIAFTITDNIQQTLYTSSITANPGDSITGEGITRRKNPISQKAKDFGWTIDYAVKLAPILSIKYLGVTYIKKSVQTFTTFDQLNGSGNPWKENDSLSATIFSRAIISNNYITAAVTGKKVEFNAGMNLFYYNLRGHTAFDTANNNVIRILPTLSANFKLNKESILRLDAYWGVKYVGTGQLLAVTNYSNPLLVTVSNKNLKNEEGIATNVSYSHLFRNTLSNIFVKFGVYNGQNKITNDINYDSLGRQYSKPINLGNFNTYNFRVDYSTFLFNKKVNVNLGSNASYSQTPFKLNGIETNVEATTMSGNLGLTYLPSKALRIIGNIGGNYTKNIYTGMDNDQYAKSISIGGGFQFESKTGFTANAMYTQTINFGLPIGLSQSPEMLNMGVGKKIIKGKAEINLRVYDLLNKFNTNTRTTGIGFIQDSHTNSLQRFVLGSFTWYFGN